MSEMSPETRALLERGRDYGPLPLERRARMKSALSLRIAGMAAAPSIGAGVAWALAKKVLGFAVVAGALGGGAAVVRHVRAAHPGGSPLPSGTPSSVAQPSLAQPVEAARWDRVEDPGPTPSATQAGPVHRAATSRARAESAPAPAPRVAEPRSLAGPSTLAAPSTLAGSTTLAAPAHAGNARESTSGSPPVASPVAAAVASAALQPSTLEDEARLLREAHRAYMGGEPARALAWLGEHARLYPHGTLEPERSAERVFVLCALGADDRAASEASAFLQNHPSGALAARVASSCGSKP